MSRRRCVVLGAGGFIGAHMVKRLKAEGHWVLGVDLELPPYGSTHADNFMDVDVTCEENVRAVLPIGIDTVYQFATIMGGAGYIFTGENDARVMANGSLINILVAERAAEIGAHVFFPSSACVYPQRLQRHTVVNALKEDVAYPADPDSEYGWEKLYAERLYLAHQRNYGLSVTIARFHSIVGPEGTWTGGKEKVFAATCRKIAELPPAGGEIKLWGDGEQTRTFLYIDECLEGIERLIAARATGPVNLGSDELISMNDLAYRIAAFAGKTITIRHVDGPLGVRGRTSDHTLLRELTGGWSPRCDLDDAIAKTYPWIADQVAHTRGVRL